MGYKIRRVPKGWEHPRNEHGKYQPMYDEPFEAAAQRWKQGFFEWDQGVHKALLEHPEYRRMEYWEYASDPPTREYYRPAWTEEPTCYQIYETITEGTPDSPVFETLDELAQWLIDTIGGDYTLTQAQEFIETALK